MNDEIAKNAIITIAPGQSKKPLPWLNYPDLDELCNPKRFGGQPFNTNNVSYGKRVKSELCRADRRSCSPTRVLFMAKLKQEKELFANMNVCLRKVKGKTVTVENAMNPEYIDDMIKHDAGYRMLANIRTSPAYWEKIKNYSFAMIRQLGQPTFFMTLSPGEKRWPELIRVLYKYHHHEEITVEEAMRLRDDVKTKLVRNDPVLCAKYFQFKSDKFMNCSRKFHSIFDEYEIRIKTS